MLAKLQAKCAKERARIRVAEARSVRRRLFIRIDVRGTDNAYIHSCPMVVGAPGAAGTRRKREWREWRRA